MEDRIIAYGGQAVIEGVMMRAPHSYAITCRKSDGSLVTEQQAIPRISEKYPIFKYPILRGLGTLGQAMQLGYRALNFSTNVMLEEIDPEAKNKPTPAWLQAIQVILPFAFFIVAAFFLNVCFTCFDNSIFIRKHIRIIRLIF